MTTTEILAIIAALGGGAALREAVGGLWRWVSGRQRRERDALRQAYMEIDDANAARAAASRRAAAWSEYAMVLRRVIIRHGGSELIPPAPDDTYNSTIDP